MSALTTSVLWNRCLVASLVVNGIAVGALGVSHLAHPDAGAAKIAKSEKKPTTRLMEIRLEKEPSSGKDKTSSAADSDDKGDDKGADGVSEDGSTKEGAVTATKKSATAKKKTTAVPKPGGKAGKANVNANFGKLVLGKPQPRIVHQPNGVIDLRNVHLKGETYADPKLLPKTQLPNKTIGKSQVKIVGKATSWAMCVGSVGGNTIYGGKTTILLGKGIDIKGTKFCMPGGVPGIPGGGQGQNGRNANPPATTSVPPSPGSKGSQAGSPNGKGGNGGSKGANGLSGQGTGDQLKVLSGQASGPVRNLNQPWVSYGYRPDARKRPGGPETDLHLPATHDDPTDRVRPAAKKISTTPVVRSRFEPTPVSVGSHSLRGTIPWGPDSRKERPHGLKGDYYLGNEFDRFLFSRVDNNLDFTWTDHVVDPRMPRFHPYSVRWNGYLKPDYSEVYTLYATSDDGVRIWIDGRLVIDNWTEHAPQEVVARVALTAGKKVPIKVEYFEIDGLRIQVMKLYWESASQPKAYISSRNFLQP